MYVIVLLPDIIVPFSGNPIVESTEITDEPTGTFFKLFVFGVIVKFPRTAEVSLYPTKSEILKYCILFLVNGSISEIEALVFSSLNFLIVWPTNLEGSPEILSAITTSLLINSAEDGLIKNSSKFTTWGVTPYRILNKILNDSSVPFAW